ncbi:MAG: aromatic ring-hydroxylating oxygenase subunit alpha [Stellaceae bacterium]
MQIEETLRSGAGRNAGLLNPGALVEDRPHRFRVHSSVYTDEALFRLEMDRIFAKTWLFVGHTSEIPNPRDFKTTSMGARPVIVSRDDDGAIHVLLNRCRHRGAVLCREERGNVRNFLCPYHNWSYAPDGRLIGITDRSGPGGYSEHFEAPEGLLRVPRVEAYRGFIFASFNHDVPPLPEFLGHAQTYIDNRIAQAPDGEIVLRSTPYITRFKGNWKFQAENIIDNYHFMYVHRAFVDLQKKYGDATGDFGAHKGNSTADIRRLRNTGAQTWGCRYGHGVSIRADSDFEDNLDGPFADYYRAVVDKHGLERAAQIMGKGVSQIFPSLGLIFNQIRVWRPIAPDLTEVAIYPYYLKGAPESFNEGMLRSHERFYSPSGYGATDDVEIFTLCQQGLAGGLHDWIILERGVDSETPDERGNYRGSSSDETLIRAFWREWRRLMAAA